MARTGDGAGSTEVSPMSETRNLLDTVKRNTLMVCYFGRGRSIIQRDSKKKNKQMAEIHTGALYGHADHLQGDVNILLRMRKSMSCGDCVIAIYAWARNFLDARQRMYLRLKCNGRQT